VIIDVFSRCVVGWCISKRSNAKIAEALMQDAIFREGIKPGELTIHADNGGEMTSTTVAELLIDLGVVKSHSRPHTSNDNPFSESHFKTMKYRPEIPTRFFSVEEARVLFRQLFHWYNNEHRHSGLAMHTPATVHTGKAEEVTRARSSVLNAAYAAHPERFVNKPPKAALPPKEVWINPPRPCSEVSRDASKAAGARANCGKQELPASTLAANERSSKRQRPTKPSGDGSGGCHAATS
jgi:putative transposase